MKIKPKHLITGGDFKDLFGHNIANINDDKNILVIYPHPDDELGNVGGLMTKLAKDKSKNFQVVSITKGEKGNELVKVSPEVLAKIREEEFSKVMEILGVKNHEMWDFPDGYVTEAKAALKKKIHEHIKANNFDLVITYERGGLYGHPDHLVLSEVVHELHQSDDHNFNVLYSTLPKEIYETFDLPSTIDLGDKIVELDKVEHGFAKYKLKIGLNALKKHKGAKEYKSQNLGPMKSMPYMFLFGRFEYFTDEY